MNGFQLSGTLILLVLFAMTSCGSKKNDKELLEDVQKTLHTANNSRFSNVSAAVNEGIVTLSGSCEGTGCADSASAIVKDVKGIESIKNEITEAPQQTDLTLRTSVQAIISKYGGVQADVAEGVVVLRGTIQRDQLQPLMNELSALNAKKIDNQLAISQ